MFETVVTGIEKLTAGGIGFYSLSILIAIDPMRGSRFYTEKE